MRKFDAGLLSPIRRSLKVYPNSSLRRMMESAIVAEELHVKGQPRKQEFSTFRAKQKALQDQPKAEKSAKISKQPFSKNGANNNKKKGGKKSLTYLSSEQLKEYREQGKCFGCGKYRAYEERLSKGREER